MCWKRCCVYLFYPTSPNLSGRKNSRWICLQDKLSGYKFCTELSLLQYRMEAVGSYTLSRKERLRRRLHVCWIEPKNIGENESLSSNLLNMKLRTIIALSWFGITTVSTTSSPPGIDKCAFDDHQKYHSNHDCRTHHDVDR